MWINNYNSPVAPVSLLSMPPYSSVTVVSNMLSMRPGVAVDISDLEAVYNLRENYITKKTHSWFTRTGPFEFTSTLSAELIQAHMHKDLSPSGYVEPVTNFAATTYTGMKTTGQVSYRNFKKRGRVLPLLHLLTRQPPYTMSSKRAKPQHSQASSQGCVTVPALTNNGCFRTDRGPMAYSYKKLRSLFFSSTQTWTENSHIHLKKKGMTGEAAETRLNSTGALN